MVRSAILLMAASVMVAQAAPTFSMMGRDIPAKLRPAPVKRDVPAKLGPAPIKRNLPVNLGPVPVKRDGPASGQRDIPLKLASVEKRDAFTTVFTGQTSATVSDSFMGYGYADSAEDCKEVCKNHNGCVFVNGYFDNYGKGETDSNGRAIQFTCSLFGIAITDTSYNTNNGQAQTSGGTSTKITESAGYVLASPPDCPNPDLAWTFDHANSQSSDDNFNTIFLQQTAEQPPDYKVEGAIGRVFVNRVSKTVPLYHLYNASAADIFYTTSSAERDNAISQSGYTDRGVAGFVYTDASCGGIPLYYRYNGNSHFYTTSSTEASGYTDGGITGYIVSRPSSS